MNFLIGLIFAQIIYYSPPKKYVTNETLETYFAHVLEEREDGLEVMRVDQPTQKQVERRIKEHFPEGHYINMDDSLFQVIMEKNKGPTHWYSEELKEYPKSYTDVFLGSVSTPILGYNYVMILDRKGKIVKIEKYGYGM